MESTYPRRQFRRLSISYPAVIHSPTLRLVSVLLRTYVQVVPVQVARGHRIDREMSFRRWLRWVVLGAVVGVAVGFSGFHPGPVHAVEVISDQEQERFVGSGAVLLPGTVDSGTRWEAATCLGCRWKVTNPCLRDDEHGDAGCRGSILGCPQGREISRAWFARPGGDFEPVGLFCPSDGEVTAVSEAASQLRAGFERNIPPLRVTCQPGRGVVVGIPVHCRSLQPSGHVEWIDQVAGYQVRTSAHATWDWSFLQRGTGSNANAEWTIRGTEPGGAYPSPAIRSTFWVAGEHQVSVLARWQGSFYVDDLGPFPISPDLEQRARVMIPTGSALGVLTGGP